MIRKIQSSRIDFLVSKIVPDGILKLNPIIAGGSMLAVYRAIQLYDTDDRWRQFERRLDRAPKTSGLDSFSDVDIWFEEGNEIYEESNDNNSLISEDTKNNVSNKASGMLMQGRSSLKSLGLKSLSKSSKWANSFNGDKNVSGGGAYQFIKSKPKSPEDLIGTFDFINSMVAYKDGVMYYDGRIDSAFSSLELRLNDDSAYIGKSVASRVFNALRAFKYSTRYSLDFGPDLSRYIFNVYSDINQIDYDAYNNRVVELENLYGKKISSVDALRDMVSGLNYKFKEFIIMKSFKEEYALFLINKADSLSGLKEYVDGMASNEESATGSEVLVFEAALF